MRMGLMCITLVPINVAMKSATEIKNCQGWSRSLKFSADSSNKVAAANRPTTAGRNPRKRLCTMWVCMYFMNILLIKIISVTEGNTSANVAVALPSMDMPVEKPALCTAV